MTEDSHAPDPVPDGGSDSPDFIGGLRDNLSFPSVPWTPGKEPEPAADAPEDATDDPAAAAAGSPEDATPLRSWMPSRPPLHPVALLAIVGVVLVLGIVGVVHFAADLSPHRPAGTAAATASARKARSARALAEMASQVHTIVAASASADRDLQRAVDRVRSCTGVPAAAGQIRKVVGRQRELITMAATIDMRPAAQGTALKLDLMTTLHDSLQAGRQFLGWAGKLSSHCRFRPHVTRAYRAGVRLSGAARSRRAAVDALWNPIARAESYPAETADAW